ncbi:tape measure protein [Flavonifractor plautii]|uniref:tape measure protein n=1 Tax=Flavonifractor plautii TaxID=292800 RepID=UPI00195DBA8B|nr:tape measure protein [Flavonifractor plautii]MBM6665642.1 tape measure protein [Flavonifractor plautii]
MAEEVGIVMSLYDRVSPTLKAIAGNSKAFDKSLDELEASLKAYDKAQESLVKRSANLKKSLAEADQEVKNAQKSYKKLNDEVSKKALDEAIDRQAELRRELTETESSLRANAKAYDTLYENARKAANGVQTVTVASSKAENRAGSGSTGILSALGQAGLISMAGDAAGQWANVLLGSAYGGATGTLLSSGLSGAVQGAAMGSLLGPVGTVAGAVVGGGIGLITGGSQIYQERDDAFKAYVQEATEGQMEDLSSSITSGSATAAQRELDLIAFDQLLGGRGAKYLDDLREMAAATPMEYEDLTAMSRALATGFGKDQQRMLDLMESIGNAGSAVGVDASGMTYMSQVMSRMQSSGKVSLEDLNAFQDRGINVIGMLSDALGKSQGDIYDMISKGSISGTKAVDIIQQGLEQYAGAMDKMSQTFSGLESTLADAQTEMDNAYGEGYNETRKKGLQEEIDYLSGESGALIQEANRAMGAWQAELENSKEQYIRDAMDAVINSDEYKAAMSEGTDEGYAEAGRMLMEAKVRGMNEYNASEGAQLMLQLETEMAATIRDDTASNDAYWDAGYRKGQEYSKGWAAARASQWIQDVPEENTVAGRVRARNHYRYAYGLDRVPYNDFPALLHEGERVLTAQEARAQDRAAEITRAEPAVTTWAEDILAGARASVGRLDVTSGPAAADQHSAEPTRVFNFDFSGSTFGDGLSAEEIAQRLADAIELKFAAGVLS